MKNLFLPISSDLGKQHHSTATVQPPSFSLATRYGSRITDRSDGHEILGNRTPDESA
jgi:hypothetical protein